MLAWITQITRKALIKVLDPVTKAETEMLNLPF